MTLDEMEKGLILDGLQKNGFNLTKTAAYLGLTRGVLFRRIRYHELKVEVTM